MKKRLLLLPLISLFALSSCDLIDEFFGSQENAPQQDDSNEQKTDIAVTGVKIVKTSINLEEGQNETLQYTVLPSNATNKAVSWNSSDEDVVSVADGTIYAISEGEALITVKTSDGGFTDACIVTVTKNQSIIVNVESIDIIKQFLTIEIDDSFTLDYKIYPEDATNKAVSWSSTNESVLTVENGTIKGCSEGNATIKVITLDGNFMDQCYVSVVGKGEKIVYVESFVLNTHSISVDLSDNPTLTYTILPENATNKQVNWYSSDDDVVIVDNGTLYPQSVGEARITATTYDGNFSDFCDVIVTGTVNVTSINLVKSSIEIEIGSEEAIQYSIYPTNATNKNVIWSSSNNSIATIDNGVVKAVSKGQATVTVCTVDGNKTDTCAINVIDSMPQDDPSKNGEFYGGLVEGPDFTGYEFSKSKETIEKPSNGVGDINVFAFNDFHGSIIKQKTSSGNEIGLKQLGTFYKEKSQEDNTLIFDQGDTWQGSFESNYTYGALIEDVFTYSGVTARTVGNHDFDWGLTHLEQNSNRKYDGDYLPCLAANVYDYGNGINGDIQQSQLGKEYCTYILDNGIKVGVIGVIGDDQITSICSQLVSTICFTNYVQKIKEISDFLREEKDCDVIIASTHEGSGNARYSSLTDVSPNSGKRYVDLVLGGHSHYRQEYTIDGVKFVQWNSNGVNTGKVTLKYDFSTNQLIDEQTVVDSYVAGYFDSYYPVCEPTINTLVDEYLGSVDSVANEVLSTNFSGEFDTGSLARLMTEAIYERVSKTVPDVQFASSNYARTSFSGTTFTYRDLYKCFPFDNEIILMDVSSSRGLNSLKSNYTYRGDISLNPSYGNSYKCAIIDYVAVHQNSNRKFDYFPDAENDFIIFNDTDGDAPTYREILYEYLKDHSNKSFDVSNYSSSCDHYIS